MGGFFGVASREDCTLELFYGVDYHSHLGTRRGGMATYGANGFSRAIHNIENSPFRTKFERDVAEMEGHLGIGCISDYEPQPLLIQSHLGSFAITTVGKINNMDKLLENVYGNGRTHFQEMSTGQINATELAASLICSEKTITEGIRHLQDVVDGSMTLLLMTKDGIYAARDKKGRTPLVIGKKEGAYCASFENFAYLNLGYTDYHELGPGEIDFITPESVEMLVPPQEEMKICSFLWVYYGYPTASYEGINVEEMRYHCGAMLAKRDAGSDVHPDLIAGVPDSVINRAKELVEELSDADITAAVKDLTAPKKKQKIVYDQVDMAQMSLFDTVQDNDIVDEIRDLDMTHLTPMEAMNILYNLQNKIKNRW